MDPPYCPKLQQIEIFWANGKNHVAELFADDTTIRDVVRRLHLQDGWCGNENHLKESNAEFTCGMRCRKLVEVALQYANVEYLPLCTGLKGAIGTL